ncbi:MAG: divalent-cation tolerance protein CutA [bacterium]|nr:divalent-cation tolerance protein CutA [bacterium]
MIFIYSTFPNKKEAEEIGERLVKNKLVACVNIFPIESVYFWPASAKASVGKQNKIIKEKEFAAIFKTKKENFRKVEKFILENHSYNTPCIIEIPLGRITKKYLSWLG